MDDQENQTTTAGKSFWALKKKCCVAAESAKLELELKQEKKIHKNKIDRVRHKGELILHSKAVLMLIVLMNLVDCILVLSELILDIHYVKELIDNSDLQSRDFINKMEARYPEHLYDNDIDHMDVFYSHIIAANCEWKNYTSPIHPTSTLVKREVIGEQIHHLQVSVAARFSREKRANFVKAEVDDKQSYEPSVHKTAVKPHAHSIWEDIAHGLHKASITILAVLFVENIFKICFMGRRFFEHRIEVFDAIIVLISFVVDLVFLKGLTEYRIQDGIFILSFLLPWRVLRVVNSLIVAVLDNAHFRLKMMYKHHKSTSAELKAIKEKEKMFQIRLKNIEAFLLNEGIPISTIHKLIPFDDKKSTITSMASFALSGVVPAIMDTESVNNVCIALGRTPNNDNKDGVSRKDVGVSRQDDIVKSKDHTNIHDGVSSHDNEVDSLDHTSIHDGLLRQDDKVDS